MKRLELAREAVVIGGFSEGSDLMDPTRTALSSDGEHGLFESAIDVSPNIADIQANPEAYSRIFEGKTLVLHSYAGLIASRGYFELNSRAKGIILLNPVEGDGVYKTVKGACKVAFQKNNQAEDEGYIMPFTQGPKELARHPVVNFRNIFRAAKFSTISEVLRNEDGYLGGLGYFEYDNDEFKFQDVLGNAPQILQEHGYDAARFSGQHMAPIYRPDDTALQLTKYLDSTQ